MSPELVSAVVQVVAVCTMPLSTWAIVQSRLNQQKPIRWQEILKIVVLTTIPVLLILGVRGVLSQWVAAVGIAGDVLVAVIHHPENALSSDNHDSLGK